MKNSKRFAVILFAIALSTLFGTGCVFWSVPVPAAGQSVSHVPLQAGETAVALSPNLTVGDGLDAFGTDLGLSHQPNDFLRLGVEGTAGLYQGLGSEEDLSTYGSGRGYVGLEPGFQHDWGLPFAPAIYFGGGYMRLTPERNYATMNMSGNVKFGGADQKIVIGAGFTMAGWIRLGELVEDENGRTPERNGRYFGSNVNLLFNQEHFFFGIEGALGFQVYQYADMHIRTGFTAGTTF